MGWWADGLRAVQAAAVRPLGAAPRGDPDRLWLAMGWLNAGLAVVFLLGMLLAETAAMRTEAELVNAAAWYRAGVGPHRVDGLPWLFVPYGRLPIALYAALPRFGHPYLAGRLVSLLAAGVLLWMVVGYARRCGGDRRTVTLVLLVAVSSRPLLDYAAAVRVDLPTVLLSFSGWWLVTATADRRRRWAGIGLLALALQCKLTALTMPLAAVCYLAPRDRVAAREVVLGVGLLALAGVALDQHLSGGAYLDVVGSHRLRLVHGLEILSRLYTVSWPWHVALLGLIVCVPMAVHRRGADTRWLLLAAYAVTFATGCNLGASWNYLLEPYLACWLITAVLYAARPEQPCALNRWVRAWLVLYFGFALVQMGYRLEALWERRIVDEPRVGERQEELAPLTGRVAILGPDTAVDAWAGLGRLNWVLPVAARQRAAETTAWAALADGRLDTVVDPAGRITFGESTMTVGPAGSRFQGWPRQESTGSR